MERLALTENSTSLFCLEDDPLVEVMPTTQARTVLPNPSVSTRFLYVCWFGASMTNHWEATVSLFTWINNDHLQIYWIHFLQHVRHLSGEWSVQAIMSQHSLVGVWHHSKPIKKFDAKRMDQWKNRCCTHSGFWSCGLLHVGATSANEFVRLASFASLMQESTAPVLWFHLASFLAAL